MRLIVLVDGEHYPPVVREGLETLRSAGHDIVCAVFCGGSEKIRAEELDTAYGVRLFRADDAAEALRAALLEHDADAVFDMSDEPVLSGVERSRLASHTLAAGVAYLGPGFELRPPPMEPVFSKPTIRVIATGKRTGKTAVAGALARHASHRGWRPAVLAMGRGGPPDPQLVEAGEVLDPARLLAIADAGLHAASDYLEDAVTSGVTTIGCRRAGGGMAGEVFASNVAEGARLAERRAEDLVILEGSGAAVPPVLASAGVVCVPAGIDPSTVQGHLTPYRLLISDVAVVTMADDEAASARTHSTIRDLAPHIHIVRTVFRPRPVSAVGGRRAFVCTTAPAAASELIAGHLSEFHGCEVVGMSHALADRPRLEHDVRSAADHDVLLTEVKGAAIDVAVRISLQRGTEVVFLDNDLAGDAIAGAFDLVLDVARRRAAG